jgi:HSP20 family molecular chaperone IbpA
MPIEIDYYSRHLLNDPPLDHTLPFMGFDPYPTTPTSADPSEPLSFHFPSLARHTTRHPTPEELRRHLSEVSAEDSAFTDSLLRDTQLRRHLAEVGADRLATIMTGVSISAPAVSSSGRALSFAGASQSCTLRTERDSYVFEAQTPGVKKDDMKLEVVGRRLELTVFESQAETARSAFLDKELELQEQGSNREEERAAFLDKELVLQHLAETAASCGDDAARAAFLDKELELQVQKLKKIDERAVTSAESLHEIEVEGQGSPEVRNASSSTIKLDEDKRNVLMTRSVSLPPDADPSSIAVSYDLGVLRAYIARSTGPFVPGPEGDAARAARSRVNELREELRTAEREATQAEEALRAAVVEARRTESTRRTVVAI